MCLGKTIEHRDRRMTSSKACIGAWRGVCMGEKNRSPPLVGRNFQVRYGIYYLRRFCKRVTSQHFLDFSEHSTAA